MVKISDLNHHDLFRQTLQARPRSWSIESTKSIENRPSRIDQKIID